MTSSVHAHSDMVHKMKLTAMEHRFVTSGKDDGDKFGWLSVQVKWEVESQTHREFGESAKRTPTNRKS